MDISTTRARRVADATGEAEVAGAGANPRPPSRAQLRTAECPKTGAGAPDRGAHRRGGENPKPPPPAKPPSAHPKPPPKTGK
jgi:hypothetical protein